MTHQHRPPPKFKALGEYTELPTDHPFTEALDELMQDASHITWHEWLFGDANALNPQLMQLRTMMHNSKQFRAFILNSHENPEAEWARLLALSGESGKADQT